MQTSWSQSPDTTAQPSQTDRDLWPAWDAALRRWGLNHLAATVFESAGPLNLLLAQMLYFGQPLMQAAAPGAMIPALARLLDDPRQAAQFAAYLREEERQ